MARVLTLDEVDGIQCDALAGDTVGAIAARYDVTRETVRSHLDAAGINRPRYGLPNPRAFQPAKWAEQALCAKTDPDLWFPDKGGTTREAIAICRSCPVAFECLEYALTNNERFGVWGGLSERQRARLHPSTNTATATAERTAS